MFTVSGISLFWYGSFHVVISLCINSLTFCLVPCHLGNFIFISGVENWVNDGLQFMCINIIVHGYLALFVSLLFFILHPTPNPLTFILNLLKVLLFNFMCSYEIGFILSCITMYSYIIMIFNLWKHPCYLHLSLFLTFLVRPPCIFKIQSWLLGVFLICSFSQLHHTPWMYLPHITHLLPLGWTPVLFTAPNLHK